MEQFHEFMSAAWPWMAMGLILAVFIAFWGSKKVKKNHNIFYNYCDGKN
jgi:hypothetical protein